jgi:hypothetical protein
VHCKSGVLANGHTVDVHPDPDCAKEFCATELGRAHCANVRAVELPESEAMGPMMAR